MTNPVGGRLLPWVGAIGAVLLVALGVLTLLPGSDADDLDVLPVEPDTASTSGTSTTDTAAPILLTATPAASPTPAPPNPVQVPARPVVLRNDGTPIGAQLAALGLDGFLVTIVDGAPLVHSLATGEEITVPVVDRLQRIAGEINTAGMTCCSRFGPDNGLPGTDPNWSWVPWTASEGAFAMPMVLEEDETVHMVICCDGPPVAAIASGSTNVPFPNVDTLLNLETGERKSITGNAGPITNQPRDLRPWVEVIGGGDVHLMTSYADVVYNWQWDTEWAAVGKGTIVATFTNAVLVEVCDGPAQCERELRPADGSQRKLVDYGSRFDWLSTLSPDGRYFAGLERGDINNQTLAVRVDDMDEAAQTVEAGPAIFPLDDQWFQTRDQAVSVDVTQALWVGNRHLLVAHGGLQSPMLVNVETGEQTDLAFLTRAAGAQPTFAWVSNLSGLSGSGAG